MKKFLMVLFASMIVGAQAHAAVLLEPYVAYELTGQVKGNNSEADLKGVTYGGRLGYDMMGLAVGVDYSMGTGTYEPENGSNKDSKASHMGAFVKYSAPMLLQFWGTYLFQVKDALADVTIAGKTGDQTSTGSGFVLGVGYTGLPFVAVNLTYTSIGYKEYEHPAFASAIDSDSKYSSIGLGISLPLSF